MSPTPRQMGQRIKALRERQGMSQATLATKAKISREYVNKLEAGRYDPTLGVVQRLAKALKIKLSDIVK
jgi:transcriptional regulator with XRE-family HTH domain